MGGGWGCGREKGRGEVKKKRRKKDELKRIAIKLVLRVSLYILRRDSVALECEFACLRDR